MTPLSIRDLAYVNPENTRISMKVMTEAFGEIPFLYDPRDTAPTTRAIGQLMEEKFFQVAPFVPPTKEEARALLPPLTPLQLRTVLIENGIMPSDATTLLASVEDPKERVKAEAAWEYASHIERDHPLIAMAAAAFDMTEAQVDEMWLVGLET